MGSGFSSCRKSDSTIANPPPDIEYVRNDDYFSPKKHAASSSASATEARRDHPKSSDSRYPAIVPNNTASNMIHNQNKKKLSSSYQRFYNPNERLDQEGQTLAGLARTRTHITIKHQQPYYDDGDPTTKHIYARRYLPSLNQQIEEDEEVSQYDENYDPNDFGQFFRRNYQTYLMEDFKLASAIVPKGIGSLIYTTSSLTASPISGGMYLDFFSYFSELSINFNFLKILLCL